MIGNDIVDLHLAKVQSNWQRSNYLEKICTLKEQNFIRNCSNPEVELWKLWSRKEATYKIYNRETGIRGYLPWKLECSIPEDFEGQHRSTVTIEDKLYFTETVVNSDLVYTVAVSEVALFSQIISIERTHKIIKINDLPVLECSKIPVSITNHGRFERKITLLDI